MSAPNTPERFSSMREFRVYQLLYEIEQRPKVEECNQSIDPRDELIRQLREENDRLRKGIEILFDEYDELNDEVVILEADVSDLLRDY